MAGIMSRIFGGREPASSKVAKERLQLVLIHDRSNLTPEQVQSIKDEILMVIARYVDFDPDTVEVVLTNEDRSSILRAEIPILQSTGPRRRRAMSLSEVDDLDE